MGIAQQARWEIDLALPIGPQLHRILRERVIQADLLPGAVLSEAEIAREYAVSRQPVREAFIKLASDGFVEIRPQRGTVVCKISIAAVLAARFVRESVEADVAKLLAGNLSAPEIASLRQTISLQRESVKNNWAHFLELDERFHRRLFEYAGKSDAWHVIDELKTSMDRARYMTTMRLPIDRFVEQHERIVETIVDGDPEQAESAMRNHLSQTLVDLPKLAAAAPDMFSLDSDDVNSHLASHQTGGKNAQPNQQTN